MHAILSFNIGLVFFLSLRNHTFLLAQCIGSASASSSFPLSYFARVFLFYCFLAIPNVLCRFSRVISLL